MSSEQSNTTPLTEPPNNASDDLSSRIDATIKRAREEWQTVIASDRLPTEMGASDKREALERAGVVFGDVVQGNEMFTYVTLPEGWTKVETDYIQLTDVVDEKGRKRATLFFNNDDDERIVHTNIYPRFTYEREERSHPLKGILVMNVKDGDTAIFTTAEYPYFGEKEDAEWYSQYCFAIVEAQEWLFEHYPNWQDPSAYWD